YLGADSFTYTLSDGQGGTSVGTVSVTVAAPPNQPPVATADSATTTRNTAALIDVPPNRTHPDGGTLSTASVTNAPPATVTIQTLNLLYTPSNLYLGADSFTYTLSDGQGGTSVGAVSVNVTAPPSNVATVTFRQGTAGYTGTV